MASGVHDVSDGGLAIAAAEMAIEGGLGCTLELPSDSDELSVLFGESANRVLLAVSSAQQETLTALAHRHEVPIARLGVAGGNRFRLGSHIDLEVEEIRAIWTNAIPDLVHGDPGTLIP